jgi:anti-anti-sigma factor
MMMEITVSEHKGEKTVTIISIDGKIDGTNYTQLIDKAKELCNSGTENILLDMEKCGFLSSAGIMAILSVAQISRGVNPSDSQRVWVSYDEMKRDINKASGVQLKVVNLQSKVKQSLEITGILNILDLYDDLETALASF